MNYQDFRKTYAWTLKNYGGTYELFCGDFYAYMIGKCTTKRFEKDGRKWNLVSETNEDVTPAFYFNTINAVPFFKRLGGSERVECGYCVRGYVPLKVTSISPDKASKVVREFKLF